MSASPSKAAKAAGLKSLAEMSEISSVKRMTLNNWFNDRRQLFDIVLIGCVMSKQVRAITACQPSFGIAEIDKHVMTVRISEIFGIPSNFFINGEK